MVVEERANQGRVGRIVKGTSSKSNDFDEEECRCNYSSQKLLPDTLAVCGTSSFYSIDAYSLWIRERRHAWLIILSCCGPHSIALQRPGRESSLPSEATESGASLPSLRTII